MFYNSIKQEYGIKTMRLYKQYNNMTNQINKTIMDKMFLIRCRKDKIIPKFIHDRTKRLFQTPILEQYKTKIMNLIHRTNRKILNMEIRMTMERCKSKMKTLFLLRQSMYRLCPRHVVNKFVNTQKISGKITKQRINLRLNGKYEKLRAENALRIHTDPGWFINLTEKEIPSDVETMLALGKKFAVPHKAKEIPLFNVVADIETVTKSIEDKNVHNMIRSKAATVVSNHMHKTDSSMSRGNILMQRMYDSTKKFLNDNKDIVVIGADKSNVSIAIKKTEYEDKMDIHFGDTNMFRRMTSDPTKVMQDKNNNIVRQLYKDKHINKRTKKQLMIFTAQSPRPHATIKLHKLDRPIRVITDGTNSPSYNMAKYINDLCKKAVPSTQFNIRNSFELLEKLKTIRLDESDLIVSFDIVSMFLTIPLELVYKSVRKRWLQISEVTTIPWDTMKGMLKFCLADTNYVQWNGKIYRQIDGLTIGGCASSIMADFVVTDIMQEVVQNCGYDPKLMVKYVDDILAVVPKEELENTLSIFNTIHPSLKFTVEIEDNCSIPYLDIRIIRNKDGTVSTDFYQKPTCSNRILNYNSAHPMVQKTGTAYGFISRVLTLSSEEFHNINIGRLHNILGMNGYPASLVHRLIQKVMRLRRYPTSDTPVETVMRYRGIGYIQHLSENIVKIFSKYDKTLRIGYKTTKNLQSLMRNNDVIKPDTEKHGVIYSVQCKGCDGVYIGQTGQKLKNRIKQHKSDNRARHMKVNTTGLVQHSINTGHTFDFEQTKVVATQPQLSKRLVLETLYINKHRVKSVNLKDDIENMSPVYTQLLNRH